MSGGRRLGRRCRVAADLLLDLKARPEQDRALGRAVGCPEGHVFKRHPEEAGEAKGLHGRARRLEVPTEDLRANVDAEDHLQRLAGGPGQPAARVAARPRAFIQ